jgi:6-phosphogluconolactonase
VQLGMINPIPAESPDLEAAAVECSLALRDITGSPAALDLIHLGLGLDGHTASIRSGWANAMRKPTAPP